MILKIKRRLLIKFQNIDTTKITNKECWKFNVITLSEKKIKLIEMNNQNFRIKPMAANTIPAPETK